VLYFDPRVINAELRQPHTDRGPFHSSIFDGELTHEPPERQALNSTLSTALSDALRKILTHTSSERGRAAVPLITNPFNGLSPFPFNIRVKVGGVEVAS
jgi:autophagy-related protein 101